ncbi:MAG TPA: glycerate kinase [Sedimentisphaerales bacterium]|jgi:glycerate kinase|nr:glycerate kinase [Sedimentisphaerales bacterium]HNU29795.1 glycerate kinase [Sedimentisphaerales bacterium]
MKVVVAMDSFKGSLTAARACDIVAEAIRSAVPGAVIVSKPMADGGEGTATTLMAATGGTWIEVEVMGPLPEMRVAGGFAWLPETRTAVVEMAIASGLPLLRPDQYNPLKTTTYGTGQLIQAAIGHGAEQILLAIGGSATVDGGVGAAMALGWRFLRSDGREIALGGGHLSEIDQILPPGKGKRQIGPTLRGKNPRLDFSLSNPGRAPSDMNPALFKEINKEISLNNIGPICLFPSQDQPGIPVAVKVLCDVDDPLCGEHGAAHVYGPQKGATPEMVEILNANLSHLARLVKDQFGLDIRDLPGAGAAGGLAAGAVAFLDGRLVSGVDEVIAQNHLKEELSDADWVITGEGKFDHQSLRGKVVSGVARAAREAGARVAVLAGQVRLSREVYTQAGIEVALSCMTGSMTLDQALAHAEPLLIEAARKFVDLHVR